MGVGHQVAGQGPALVVWVVRAAVEQPRRRLTVEAKTVLTLVWDAALTPRGNGLDLTGETQHWMRQRCARGPGALGAGKCGGFAHFSFFFKLFFS